MREAAVLQGEITDLLGDAQPDLQPRGRLLRLAGADERRRQVEDNSALEHEIGCPLRSVQGLPLQGGQRGRVRVRRHQFDLMEEGLGQATVVVQSLGRATRPAVEPLSRGQVALAAKEVAEHERRVHFGHTVVRLFVQIKLLGEEGTGPLGVAGV